jgi:hypothetical protein
MSLTRIMMLFTKGLMEPLKGWVKTFKPTNLQEVIWKSRDLGPPAKQKFIPWHLSVECPSVRPFE